MSERADSMLVYDLRAFAQNYSGTPFGSRCKTAADELDRLYELERRYETSQSAQHGDCPASAASKGDSDV